MAFVTFASPCAINRYNFLERNWIKIQRNKQLTATYTTQRNWYDSHLNSSKRFVKLHYNNVDIYWIGQRENNAMLIV